MFRVARTTPILNSFLFYRSKHYESCVVKEKEIQQKTYFPN